MLSGLTIRRDKMLAAARAGFINATDCADYLVGKGIPFREAYHITAGIVKDGVPLEELPLEKYKEYCPAFEGDIYEAVDLLACVRRRRLPIEEQIGYLRSLL